MYNDDIATSLKAKINMETVLSSIVFNLGFVEKKNLIHDLFGLSRSTMETIEKINTLRNAIAHRYDEDDRKFYYHGKNILHDHKILENFVYDYFSAIREALKLETKLLDVIEKAKNDYDL